MEDDGVMRRPLLTLVAAATALTALPATVDARMADSGRASPRDAALSSRTSAYGRILTDARGFTLYVFTRDRRSGRSACYGDCAVAWPPFLVQGRPRAGRGIDARKLGTTRRTNGARQVTYNGHPLYYYVSELKPNQVFCQNIAEFGGTWLVADRAGRAIR